MYFYSKPAKVETEKVTGEELIKRAKNNELHLNVSRVKPDVNYNLTKYMFDTGYITYNAVRA